MDQITAAGNILYRTIHILSRTTKDLTEKARRDK